jgi:hypothetical protein
MYLLAIIGITKEVGEEWVFGSACIHYFPSMLATFLFG